MRKQLNALKAMYFSYYALNAVLLPFLPLYFQQKGYTSMQIGLLMMMGPFVAVFAQPVWGYISDRLRTVKAIIAILWGLTIAVSVGLFLAGSFMEAFAFSLLLYFFMMPSAPLIDSMTIQTAIREGRSYGSVRLWGSIGFMVVAVVTGWILTHIGGIVRLPYLYWGLWLIPIISILFLKDQPAEGMKISLKSLGVVFKNRDFLWFLFLVMIISIPHRMNDSFFGLYLHHLGASNSFVGWAFAASAGSEILVFVYIGKLLNKFHELALLGVIAIFYMFRWLSYALIASPIVITFLQLSHGITFAAFWSVAVLYPTKLIPDHMRSTGQSLLAAVFIGVAGILGGLVGGWIQELFSWSAMYLFGAATAAAAAILFFATHAYYLKRGTAADMDTFANNME